MRTQNALGLAALMHAQDALRQAAPLRARRAQQVNSTEGSREDAQN